MVMVIIIVGGMLMIMKISREGMRIEEVEE